jgi:hypothetical protein
LLHDTPAPRADRQPDGQLLAARERAKQEQIADVRARDKQHGDDDDQRDDERRLQNCGAVKRCLP